MIAKLSNDALATGDTAAARSRSAEIDGRDGSALDPHSQ